MAAQMNRHFHPSSPIDADSLIFANGVTSVCVMVAFSLCNAGDALLFSRPAYGAFKHDFGMTAQFVEQIGLPKLYANLY